MIVECPLHPVIPAWTVWSACTKSCQSGSQQRARTCAAGKFGGTACPVPQPGAHLQQPVLPRQLHHPQLRRLVHLHQVVRPGRAVSQPHRHQGRPARRLRVPAPRRDAQLQPAGLRHRRWRRRLLRPQLACRRFYELLGATAEALVDRCATCRRWGPPRIAPSVASRRRPRTPCRPAPARPPPSRPIVALSLGLGALKRGEQPVLSNSTALRTGLQLKLVCVGGSF